MGEMTNLPTKLQPLSGCSFFFVGCFGGRSGMASTLCCQALFCDGMGVPSKTIHWKAQTDNSGPFFFPMFPWLCGFPWLVPTIKLAMVRVGGQLAFAKSDHFWGLGQATQSRCQNGMFELSWCYSPNINPYVRQSTLPNLAKAKPQL
eukprot:2333240-Amphidinium_carterae.1